MSEQMENLFRWVNSPSNTPEQSLVIATIAVATATAELVEQQRVANLLAVHFSREKYGDIEGASELWNNHIRSALGIGGETDG